MRVLFDLKMNEHSSGCKWGVNCALDSSMHRWAMGTPLCPPMAEELDNAFVLIGSRLLMLCFVSKRSILGRTTNTYKNICWYIGAHWSQSEGSHVWQYFGLDSLPCLAQDLGVRCSNVPFVRFPAARDAGSTRTSPASPFAFGRQHRPLCRCALREAFQPHSTQAIGPGPAGPAGFPVWFWGWGIYGAQLWLSGRSSVHCSQVLGMTRSRIEALQLRKE